jgi:EmrB/QacA subfamily drug resistance transporter
VTPGAAPRPPAAPPPAGSGLPLIDDPSVVLDPASDPGGASLGTTGAEASVDLPWPALIRHRVQARAQESPRYEWWVLAALLAGLLSLNITFTVFVVALPTVAHQFHSSYSVLTWVTTGPLLAFGLAAPIAGKAGDLFGHRRLYLWGLVGAMVSAVLTATALGAGMLIFARVLDGVQGAATGTASMALILRLFAPEDRVKAMGWWSMVGAGGPVIGVTLGSPIIQYFGWRALFWGQLGLLVVSFAVVALVLPAHGPHSLEAHEPAPASRWEGMDWIGSWSLSAAVVGVMLGLSIGSVAGWTAPGCLVPVALAVVATGVFVHRERTAAAPLIPPEYFRRRNFTLPMGARSFMFFAYFGGLFLFPLMMEQVYGYSETQVGLMSIARPLAFSLCSPVAGYLAVRIGERTSAVVGAAAVVSSMVAFAVLGHSPPLAVILLALVLSGVGVGVAGPATASTQANAVDPSRLGVMSAAQQLATQVGEVAGIQILITVQASRARHTVPAGTHGAALLPSFHTAFWVGTVVAAAGLVCAAFIRSFDRTGVGALDEVQPSVAS